MKTLITFFLIIRFSFLFAQDSKIRIIPQDANEYTVDEIIQDLILDGVEIINKRVNFSYYSSCMGVFIDPTRSMGVRQGMILSTGSVESITGGNTQSNYTSIAIDSTQLKKYLKLAQVDSLKYKDSVSYYSNLIAEIQKNNIGDGDVDLSNEIKGLVTFDARVIEIEFIPNADTFYYRYVFASEEYDEYVCSPFNDIFCFYLFEEGKEKRNTALVPEKDIPVSINNINGGNPSKYGCAPSNSHLYQRNNGNQGLLFDGFTKVLDIRVKVNPGKRYLIKIAIADASDSNFDSAVLIERGSIFSYFNSFEILFSRNSYKIKDSSKLTDILKELQKHPNSRIQLIGHSDVIGSDTHNLLLSMERVKSIKEFLIMNGVSEARIIEKYKGELMPRYKENWKNRRVEIFILGE